MRKQTHILFFIPVWQRRHITRVCYTGLERFRAYLKETHQISSEVLIISSDPLDTALAKEFNHHVFVFDNMPLGRKFNAGMAHALSEFKQCTHVWQINSDNLLANELADLFAPLFEQDKQLFGINKLFFYDTLTDQMMYYEYLGGCGIRVLSRELLERVGYCYYVEVTQSRAGATFQESKGEKLYVPVSKYKQAAHSRLSSAIVFKLWRDESNRVLDDQSLQRIYQYFTNDYFPMRLPSHETPLVCDIKSDTNIWTFENLPRTAAQRYITGKERADVERMLPELKQLQYARQRL